ncbi:MAG: hypothetical protein R2830_08070 [Saprospiraceae bacterium]
MTIVLRKWHRMLWPFLALLLICGTIAAVLVKPGLPDAESEGPSIAIELNNSELTVEMTSPIQSPALLLYLSDNQEENVEKDLLLGLAKQGKNTFSIAPDAPQKILKGYDGIQQKLIFQQKTALR